MTLTKFQKGGTITLLAGFLILLMPNTSYAGGDLVCTNDITNLVTHANIIVPKGEHCTIGYSIIYGNIVLNRDSSLSLTQTDVLGNVEGKNIDYVTIALISSPNGLIINGANAIVIADSVMSTVKVSQVDTFTSAGSIFQDKVSISNVDQIAIGHNTFDYNFDLRNAEQAAFTYNTFDGNASCKNIDELTGDGTNIYNQNVNGCPA